MEFLLDCAQRLDEGAPADDVLADLAARYTTPRSLSVKTCLVRQLCRPTDEHTRALAAACAAHPDAADALRRGRAGPTDDDATRKLVAALPPRLPSNVRALRVSRAQMLECKRLGARSAMRKNREGVRVDGRALLAYARDVVARPQARSLPTLAFALMLVTGRRTCEVLNGHSCVVPDGEYFVRFVGQAKRRTAPDTPLRVPVLERADVVAAALAALRRMQGDGVRLTNQQTTRRYQSLLSRSLAADDVWRPCRRVHGLRAIYASMALRLFDWAAVDPPPSPSYVAMSILGHVGLSESLVYTTYHLGAFDAEPSLGVGVLDAPAPADETPAGTNPPYPTSASSLSCRHPLVVLKA